MSNILSLSLSYFLSFSLSFKCEFMSACIFVSSMFMNFFREPQLGLQHEKVVASIGCQHVIRSCLNEPVTQSCPCSAPYPHFDASLYVDTTGANFLRILAFPLNLLVKFNHYSKSSLAPLCNLVLWKGCLKVIDPFRESSPPSPT